MFNLTCLGLPDEVMALLAKVERQTKKSTGFGKPLNHYEILT
jgi:hypothetical protein